MDAREGEVAEEVNEPPEWWGHATSRCGFWCAAREVEDGIKIVPLMCGRWVCGMCGRIRRQWFTREVRKAVKEHNLQYFWTLTIDHGTCTPLQSFELITKAWNRFRTDWTADHGPLTFIWVVEPQQSGHAHLHVVVDRFMEFEEVQERWRQATEGSYIVWVRQLDSDRVAQYLAKYLAKFAGIDALLPGYTPLKFRHKYGKSHTIEFTPFRPHVEGWALIRRPYEAIRELYYKYGSVLDDRRAFLPYFVVPSLDRSHPLDARHPLRIVYAYFEGEG